MGNIRNVNSDLEVSIFKCSERESIVKILGILRIDGTCENVPQGAALVSFSVVNT